MKKLLVLLILISFTVGVFADDALVMPEGVIRAYFVGSYGMTDSAYDSDGEEQDSDTGETKFFNQGYAVELGVTDSITAALQWVPGHNLYSDVENAEDVELSGAYDLFAGAKIQILGDHGFVKNDQFRFSMAPGFRIPLDSYDAVEEAENYLAGDSYRASGVSNESLGIGSRIYFDYIVNENFFLNLYSEIIYNIPVDKTSADLGADAIGAAMMGTDLDELEYKYGTDMVFEFEPQYSYSVTDKSSLKFYLPVNYAITQDVEVEGEKVDDSGSKYLQLRPGLGYFCGDFKVPFEASVQYGLPLMGENTAKMHTIVFKLKVYARLWE